MTQYRTIVADPPWPIEPFPKWGAEDGTTPVPYPTMELEDIAALPVRGLADRNAHLYLWTINAYVEETYEIARVWGFNPIRLLTWCKPPRGLGLGGRYVSTTEFVLYATRGVCPGGERIDTSWWQLAARRSFSQARGVPRHG